MNGPAWWLMLYIHSALRFTPDVLCSALLRHKFGGIWDAFGPREPFLFIHIPKNAGTHISHTLYGHFINHYPLRFYQLGNPLRVATMCSVAVLRDPAMRFMSAIYHLMYGERLIAADEAMKQIMLTISHDPLVVAERFFTNPLFRWQLSGSILFLPQHYWISMRNRIGVDLLYKLDNDRSFTERVVDPVRSNVSRNMLKRDDIPPALADRILDFYARDTELWTEVPHSRQLSDASALTRARLVADRRLHTCNSYALRDFEAASSKLSR